MKQLPLNSNNFIHEEKSFRQWLGTMNYSEATVYGMPLRIREFFHWLENGRGSGGEGSARPSVSHVTEIKPGHITAYYAYIKQRRNARFGGRLSNASINNQRQALQLFCDYLRYTGYDAVPYVKLQGLKDSREKTIVLTTREVRQLLKASYLSDGSSWAREMGQRDRALLAVMYGCGLRRSEARYLDVEDIHFEKALLRVTKGKGSKERLVPITSSNLPYLREYYEQARPLLVKTVHTRAFFLNIRGERIDAQSMNLRLRILVKKTANAELMNKKPTLHTLRHSIATHLLNNGMRLEDVARFLGHSSLDSTQIYTRLLE